MDLTVTLRNSGSDAKSITTAGLSPVTTLTNGGSFAVDRPTRASNTRRDRGSRENVIVLPQVQTVRRDFHGCNGKVHERRRQRGQGDRDAAVDREQRHGSSGRHACDLRRRLQRAAAEGELDVVAEQRLQG